MILSAKTMGRNRNNKEEDLLKYYESIYYVVYYSVGLPIETPRKKPLKVIDFQVGMLLRCVRDSNSSRNPFCTNILFNQVFKVQRLIQREEFAVLLSFDRLNWNNAKIVKNNNMTKFRYITHCFFEVFVLS